MNNIKEFIESGILELYVMGSATPEQIDQVESMTAMHEEIRAELYSIEVLLEDYALSQATAVDITIKPFLMATIDYMERMGNGEKPSFPPQLHANSLISDFSQWLNRADLQANDPLKEIDARIIGFTPQMTTAIVWIKNGTPPEIHTDEYENFFILEGTCNIIVDGVDNFLKPGDFFTIPLHLSHAALVTSNQICKVILQRIKVAA